jgi:hypothetical protein
MIKSPLGRKMLFICQKMWFQFSITFQAITLAGFCHTGKISPKRSNNEPRLLTAAAGFKFGKSRGQQGPVIGGHSFHGKPGLRLKIPFPSRRLGVNNYAVAI